MRTEVSDGVLILTINRPDRRNAVDRAVADALDAGLRRLDADDDLAVGILTGAGGTFSAGMDLREFLTEGRPAIVADRGFAGLTRARVAKPLIAAVEGWAVGGGFELALACDLIVAAESARFGLPEVTRGLVAAEGGVIRLPHRVPYHLAMELLLTGQPIGAGRAAGAGLVNRLVPDGVPVLDVALELAALVRGNAPLALAAVKRIVAATYDEAAAFAVQQPIAGTLTDSEDAREGARAFTERRSPVWRGR